MEGKVARAGGEGPRRGLGLQVSASSLVLLPSRVSMAITSAHVPRIPIPAGEREPEAQACTVSVLTAITFPALP